MTPRPRHKNLRGRGIVTIYHKEKKFRTKSKTSKQTKSDKKQNKNKNNNKKKKLYRNSKLSMII